MQCPRCSLPLADVNDIHACMRCNGVFLAAAANDTITRALDDAAHASAERVEAHGAGRLMNRGAACACPVCHNAMSRFRVGPVEVDTCHDHGSWYDRRELALVREALLEGAPTSTVEPAAPPQTSTGANAGAGLAPSGVDPGPAPSGLELARAPERRPRRPRDAATPLHGMPPPGGGGGIDPGASRAIDSLRASERREAEHRRHHHHDDSWSTPSWSSDHHHHRHHHHTGNDSVDVALDVIDTVFDIFD